MTSIKVWVVASLHDETRGPGCHFKSMNGIYCTSIATKEHGNAAGWLKRNVTGTVAAIVGFSYKHKTHKWRDEALEHKFATTPAHVPLAKFA